MSACPYDRKHSPALPVQSLSHYIVCRSDPPFGVRLAQTAHAAGESVTMPCPDGTSVVHLEVPDERTLLGIAALLTERGIRHKVIVENEGPYASQAMAIGITPLFDRTPVKKVTSHLALSR